MRVKCRKWKRGEGELGPTRPQDECRGQDDERKAEGELKRRREQKIKELGGVGAASTRPKKQGRKSM